MVAYRDQKGAIAHACEREQIEIEEAGAAHPRRTTILRLSDERLIRLVLHVPACLENRDVATIRRSENRIYGTYIRSRAGKGVGVDFSPGLSTVAGHEDCEQSDIFSDWEYKEPSTIWSDERIVAGRAAIGLQHPGGAAVDRFERLHAASVEDASVTRAGDLKKRLAYFAGACRPAGASTARPVKHKNICSDNGTGERDNGPDEPRLSENAGGPGRG